MNLIAVPHACMCFLCTCVYASLKAVSRPGFANRPKCCSLCRKGHSDVPRLSVPSLHLSNPRPPPLYLSADILPSVFMPYSWSQRSKSQAEPCVSSVSFLFILTLLKFAPCLCSRQVIHHRAGCFCQSFTGVSALSASNFFSTQPTT